MSKKHLLSNQQSGFTIIELMISISVLSVILLTVTVGIIQLSKSYYKGIIQATTQQTARSLIDDVSSSIEFGSFTGLGTGSASLAGTYGLGFTEQSYCIGQQRYSYVLRYQQSAAQPTSATAGYSKHSLWKDGTATVCIPLDIGKADPNSGLGGKELLGEHMRLTKFAISEAMVNGVPSNSLYNISITIMYGDDDIMDQSNPDMSKWTCKSSATIFAVAFCAKSQLTTVVGKRLS